MGKEKWLFNSAWSERKSCLFVLRGTGLFLEVCRGISGILAAWAVKRIMDRFHSSSSNELQSDFNVHKSEFVMSRRSSMSSSVRTSFLRGVIMNLIESKKWSSTPSVFLLLLLSRALGCRACGKDMLRSEWSDTSRGGTGSPQHAIVNGAQ